jgi:hypothetical protein
MKTIDKLREILCTVDVVRKQISYNTTIGSFWWDSIIKFWWDSFIKFWWDSIIKYRDIQERHLRLYCEEKWWAFAIGSTGKLIWNRNKAGSYCEMQLDNTKDFEQQSEETLLAIYNFLLEDKWAK